MKSPLSPIGQVTSPDGVRNAILVIRVSTQRQASNDEGSLKNQLQKLRGYMEFRRSFGEQWNETCLIELKGISGKDSVRSLEFQPLFEEIQTGRGNTILCYEMSRVCRSVVDFISLFEFLKEHDAEFVSLKEQLDTTTPHGRFSATILMALAQMEREITSQRTSDAMAERAKRGLWNGGQVLGYDLDPDRRGYLIPNSAEAFLINQSFDTYLELGSIRATADTINKRGYRTKSFESRQGKLHGGAAFGVSSLQRLLTNVVYIGKRSITQTGESGDQRRLVDAVWMPIVSEEKFNAVQRLMADNGQTHRNGASSVQHVYSLSGLIHCNRCSNKMDGESATGRLGTKYFYYRCSNRECGLRAAAHEVEEAIVDRLHVLAEDPKLLDSVTAETNRKLQQGRPKLEREKTGLEKNLKDVKSMADKLLTELVSMDQQAGQLFVKEKLNVLGERQLDLENGVSEVQQQLESLDWNAVDTDLVRAALGQIKDLFSILKPYEQRELMQMVLKRVEVNEREITLDLFALTEAGLPEKVGAQGDVVRMRPDWLPG